MRTHKVMDAAPFQLEITTDAPAAFHAPSCSGSLDLRLGDCMEGMKDFPDGHFDLAIVDPPYGIGEDGGSGDDLYDRAVAVVTRDGKASTSYIQRRLQIGYNRAASLMERMEQEGVVGPANHAGKREILAHAAP